MFVPVRIFSLEYVRQILNMDEMHFVTNKKSKLKLKAQVGPYILNTRAASKEVENILKYMKFKLSFTCSYEPLGVISNPRIEQKSIPYPHTPRPKIEQYANQEEWVEKALQKAEEQLVSQSSLQTPIAKDK